MSLHFDNQKWGRSTEGDLYLQPPYGVGHNNRRVGLITRMVTINPGYWLWGQQVVKLIWYEAASPPRLGSSIVFASGVNVHPHSWAHTRSLDVRSTASWSAQPLMQDTQVYPTETNEQLHRRNVWQQQHHEHHYVYVMHATCAKIRRIFNKVASSFGNQQQTEPVHNLRRTFLRLIMLVARVVHG